MFGFILGVIYQNEDFEIQQSSFDWVTEKEESNQSDITNKEPKFTVKQTSSNIIKMDDEDGTVVYDGEGGDVAFHHSMEHETSSREHSNVLFSDLGEKTAGAFEKVFQGFFSVLE